jgi:hypothetical protein
MKILKYTLLSCLIFFCSACLAQKSNQDSLLQLKKIEQIDTTTFKFNNNIWWLDINPILKKQLLNDVKQSLYNLVNDKIGVYYVNGGNAILMMEEVNKFILKKYHIVLKYTHCTPSRYQLLYSELFNKHYKEVFGKDIHNIIFTYDKWVHKKAAEDFHKKRK